MTWGFDNPEWRDDEVVFGSGLQTMLAVDLASARARRSDTPRRMPPARGDSDLKAYVAERVQTCWREVSKIYRYDQSGARDLLATRRSLFADWSVTETTISPDDRLLAYAARRTTHASMLMQAMVPLLAMGGRFYGDYLFVVDTQSGREWRLGRVDGITSPQWNADGRTFYFHGRCRLDAAAEDDAGAAGLAYVTVDGVTFSYSAGGLNCRLDGGMARFTRRGEADVMLTIAVVDTPWSQLVPKGSSRLRMRPGYGTAIQNAVRADGDGPAGGARWYLGLPTGRIAVFTAPPGPTAGDEMEKVVLSIMGSVQES